MKIYDELHSYSSELVKALLHESVEHNGNGLLAHHSGSIRGNSHILDVDETAEMMLLYNDNPLRCLEDLMQLNLGPELDIDTFGEPQVFIRCIIMPDNKLRSHFYVENVVLDDPQDIKRLIDNLYSYKNFINNRLNLDSSRITPIYNGMTVFNFTNTTLKGPLDDKE